VGLLAWRGGLVTGFGLAAGLEHQIGGALSLGCGADDQLLVVSTACNHEAM
jgi:hypothetical protein